MPEFDVIFFILQWYRKDTICVYPHLTNNLSQFSVTIGVKRYLNRISFRSATSNGTSWRFCVFANKRLCQRGLRHQSSEKYSRNAQHYICRINAIPFACSAWVRQIHFTFEMLSLKSNLLLILPYVLNLVYTIESLMFEADKDKDKRYNRLPARIIQKNCEGGTKTG